MDNQIFTNEVAETRRKAKEILAQYRAEPPNIAWAASTLIDIEDGVELVHDEARYRSILFYTEFIEGLNLPRTDADGRPVRRLRGVPVTGFDNGVAASGLVLVQAVLQAVAAQGLRWPTIGPAAAAESSPVTASHSVSIGKHDQLTAVIAKAIAKAGGLLNIAPVWIELKDLALNEAKPFTGVIRDDGSLEFDDIDGEKGTINRNALDGRLKRMKKRVG